MPCIALHELCLTPAWYAYCAAPEPSGHPRADAYRVSAPPRRTQQALPAAHLGGHLVGGALIARLSLARCRHMHWVTATSYVVAQIVGAIFAAGLLYGTIPGAANSDLGALRLNSGECCPRSRAAPASE